MAVGLFFLGILADNSAPNSNMWANRLFIISFIGLVLFIVQVILHSRNKDSGTY